MPTPQVKTGAKTPAEADKEAKDAVDASKDETETDEDEEGDEEEEQSNAPAEPKLPVNALPQNVSLGKDGKPVAKDKQKSKPAPAPEPKKEKPAPQERVRFDENRKEDAGTIEKAKIKDVKNEARLQKKADMKALRPVKNYDRAATSTEDFVKREVEEDDEEDDADLE